MATAVSKILDHLKDDGGLQGKDIANIVAVSPATVSRWSSGKATPDLKTQTVIAELRYVVDRLADFYTPEETRLWLHARHPMLDNARAIDLINSGRTEQVLAIIEALDPGLTPECPGRRVGPATCGCWTPSTRCGGSLWTRKSGASSGRAAIGPWRPVAEPVVRRNI